MPQDDHSPQGRAIPADYGGVHADIVSLLEAARRASVRSVNAVMTATYWQIGRRIVEFEQKGAARAEYGTELLGYLASNLSQRFGRGFSRQNLQQMRLFYLCWPEDLNCQTLSGNSGGVGAHRLNFSLPWSAYVRLLTVKDLSARGFYETEALRCGWSVRQLDRQISSLFYERTALSRDKTRMLERGEQPEPGDLMTPEQAIKDPFVLEFLNLKDEYSESELEEAMIHRLADFLLELGDDFAFVGRQRRLRLDDNWFRVDLLLFHRRLRCLVIIDLKAGRFSHADAGQMHMYLNYAREHWTKPDENPPVGLILCTEKGAAEARYALEGLPNQILAAQYQTVLPDVAMLANAMDTSRRELEARRIGRPQAREAD